MSSKQSFRQEMPPPGGYNPINWLKPKPNRPFPGFIIMSGFCVATIAGYHGMSYVLEWRRNRDKEDAEARIALTPFLLAEKHRLYLKYIRKNRDEEAELTKVVPEWEVGKWFNYPVYHNPRRLWIDPLLDEFYVHLSAKNQDEHLMRRFRDL